ncbi:MAG: hypothetical protein UV73_C0003G0063 [Candidatus Gottesmanbacteria bacterium GW2011_GWA2_43_14]|uniref:Peptidase S9 prolyl oligopeptidase catalytic domain-containing protein n=1 Tax=Candidatus Gottesmanbacteria bacterium GW2011_GWA2_43_14 TaxID=1618443 RepID=A0A0G1FSZ2_9BACT|nr:MAG: hypothetical protein UV73_C0003G0063 [Candidatus Gottesmanbacteria bacterium GW2011_GWA2_43_14]
MKKILIAVILIVTAGLLQAKITTKSQILSPATDMPQIQLDDQSPLEEAHVLSIASLRQQSFPGSEITIEETLPPGSNYKRYLTSYLSEGLKIFALLTIPNAEPPAAGFPAIIFNHGYIPPAQYRTTERYVAYTDAFSRNGYIVFKPDYRGHGSSEGNPAGAYGSNAYTIDVLNAASSIQKHPQVDAGKIGMWGHSMGGHITLRSMVVSKDIKAGVIWAGVVASYPDLVNNWRRRNPSATAVVSGAPVPAGGRRWRDQLAARYGAPEQNPDFWNSISANHYLSDISGPIQLHHGTADASVPVRFSLTLNKQMENAGRTVELFTYPGDDHNIAANLSTALNRSVAFFDKYLKAI